MKNLRIFMGLLIIGVGKRSIEVLDRCSIRMILKQSIDREKLAGIVRKQIEKRR